MAVENTLRIVHLSDLHLTQSDDASRSEPKLFGRLKGMNAVFRKLAAARPVQQADLLLITGDITDRGDPETWSGFWRTIRDAGLYERTRVVPGNHDVCQLGFSPPFTDTYGEAIEKMLTGLRMGSHPWQFPWEWVNTEKGVAVFGLNSNNMGNRWALNNALGILDYHQLSALACRLRKYDEIPVKIVALHHSPNIPEETTALRRGYEGLSERQRYFLEMREADRRALRLICAAGGVRMILHGHIHMNEHRMLNGVRISGTCATTEPVACSNQGIAYQFCSYRIAGSPPRIYRDLHSLAP